MIFLDSPVNRRLAEILKYQAFVTMKKEKSSLSAQKLNPELWEVEGLFRAEWYVITYPEGRAV